LDEEEDAGSLCSSPVGITTGVGSFVVKKLTARLRTFHTLLWTSTPTTIDVFGTAYWSHLQGLRCPRSYTQGSIDSLETSFSSHLIQCNTPWSRVLPEKLKRPELLKKFSAF
jgi:hypothetical protein